MTRTMLGRLIHVVGPEQGPRIRGQVWAVVVFSVLQGLAFALLVPALRALLEGRTGDAVLWWAALLVCAVASCVAYFLQAMRGFTTAIASTGALYRRLGDHLSTLGVGWFSTARLGEMTRLSTSGVGQVSVVFAHLLAPLVTAVVTPLTVVVVMLVADWRLGLAMAVTAPVLVLTHRWSTRVLGRTDDAVDEAVLEANDRILEFAGAQPVLRVFGRRTEQHRDDLDAALAAQHDAGRRRLRRSAPARGAFGITVQLAATFVVVVCGLLALTGSVDAAQVVGVLVLVARFAEPLSALSDVGAGLRTADDRMRSIQDVLDTPGLPEPEHAVEPDGHDIVLDDVWFAYPGTAGTPVLTGVSASIPEGSLTALVGTSGGGKTTVTRLIGRFFDVDTGAVRIGGRDVRDLSSARISDLVSVVFQDVYLFEGTIEDNVRFGRPDATSAELDEAVRLARVDEIVDRLPDGMATPVGEGGADLSGGERQRISLARAILKRAPILLLDEATAALDSANESAVSDTVRALAGRCTVLVVAHRLGTVADADQILVLDAGRIVERGDHTALLAAGGTYAGLWAQRDTARFWRLSSSPGGPRSSDPG